MSRASQVPQPTAVSRGAFLESRADWQIVIAETEKGAGATAAAVAAVAAAVAVQRREVTSRAQFT